MSARTPLGPADVDDAALAAMVAELLGHDRVDLLDVRVEESTYTVPSITTVGRHWVSGTARTPRGTEPFRMFVKRVQAWHHSPFFQYVPAEMREMAAAFVPWRTEALVYRSDLHDRLPEGLSMPRAVGVVDLPDDATAVWLPEVGGEPVPWTHGRYERAAYLLGRLAASPAVAAVADVGAFEWSVLHYVHGRVAAQVLPMVAADEPWQAPAFAGLRDRVRSHAARLDAYAAELTALPTTAAHGDASPHNLLPGATPGDLVLIDFGFWMPQPVGFDLGQLIAGETQVGGGPSDLAATDAACVAAYTRGLADEGLVLDEALVRRAHAVQLFVFAGLSALPDADDLPATTVARRADLMRLSVDLLDTTERERPQARSSPG